MATKKIKRTASKEINQTFVSPPRLGREIGSNPDQIRYFIKTGELKATNISSGSRPCWKIAISDWKAFLDARSNRQEKPLPKRTRREKPERQII